MNLVYKPVKIPPSAAGKKLSDYLAGVGAMVQADCGGKGTCGKCKVKVLSGFFYKDSKLSEQLLPDEDGYILSCKAFCPAIETEVYVPFSQGSGLTDFRKITEDRDAIVAVPFDADYYACALDIGTTTLACALVHVSGGETNVVSSVSRHNPQKNFGADVLSRISSASSGNLTLMQKLILDASAQMIAELTNSFSDTFCLKKLVVTGNTTMLHLFCGVSPEKMGAYPFAPEFTDMKYFKGSDLNLAAEEVFLLPSISAFIGSDIVSGVLLTDILSENEPTALIDIGTNGEMILFTGKNNGNKLYAASAAAGPALEGAGISSGVGGISGAVCSVTFVGNMPVCKTIDNKPALGICGSGLLDLIAGLRRLGYIDDTGYMDCGEFAYARTENGSALTITQQDVRAFQLAKSAIRAGFEALCDEAGISLCNLHKIYIAGGLGFYMNTDSAMATGLLDPALRGKFVNIGNSALGGAVRFAGFAGTINEINNITTLCKIIDLTRSEKFNNCFVEYMEFKS